MTKYTVRTKCGTHELEADTLRCWESVLMFDRAGVTVFAVATDALVCVVTDGVKTIPGGCDQPDKAA